MRITIEIPDDVLSSTQGRTPTVTSELSAVAGRGDALSGGESSLVGGVVASLVEAASAGMAEQGESASMLADQAINDGGGAPS